MIDCIFEATCFRVLPPSQDRKDSSTSHITSQCHHNNHPCFIRTLWWLSLTSNLVDVTRTRGSRDWVIMINLSITILSFTFSIAKHCTAAHTSACIVSGRPRDFNRMDLAWNYRKRSWIAACRTLCCSPTRGKHMGGEVVATGTRGKLKCWQWARMVLSYFAPYLFYGGPDREESDSCGNLDTFRLINKQSH